VEPFLKTEKLLVVLRVYKIKGKIK